PPQPNQQDPTGGGRDQHRSNPRGPPTRNAVKQNCDETDQRQRRPALGQRAPQLTAPKIARDGLEMIFQEVVDHIAVGRLCLIYTVCGEKQRITERFNSRRSRAEGARLWPTAQPQRTGRGQVVGLFPRSSSCPPAAT